MLIHFYQWFLPLFCYYRYIISLQESSLISVVLVKFDFTLIVWKENAKKCAALSDVLFFHFLGTGHKVQEGGGGGGGLLKLGVGHYFLKR